MVFLDGSSALRGSVGAPAVLDTLIAEHAIPPMIGIFVDPGILPALTPAVQSRFERSYEYDALNDRYSRFLLEELLPAVAKSYRLSANPDDRGISRRQHRRGLCIHGRLEPARSVSSALPASSVPTSPCAAPIRCPPSSARPSRSRSASISTTVSRDHKVPGRAVRHLLRGKLADQQSGHVRRPAVCGL